MLRSRTGTGTHSGPSRSLPMAMVRAEAANVDAFVNIGSTKSVNFKGTNYCSSQEGVHVLYSKFFPRQLFAATGTIGTLFDPAVQARQMKVGFVLTAPAQGRHARIRCIEPFHANDTFVFVQSQCFGRVFGHFLLQNRSGQYNFVGMDDRYVFRGIKRRSLPERRRWGRSWFLLEDLVVLGRDTADSTVKRLQRIVHAKPVSQSSKEFMDA